MSDARMTWAVHRGDALATLRSLPAEAVQTCITSPPYWGLRNYGHAGQMGLEPTPEEYVAGMVAVFREVRRLLRADGTLWLNLGDTYTSSGGSGAQGHTGQRADRRHTEPGRGNTSEASGLPPKSLVGIPWRVAFALQADGWTLRSDIIWAKPNPMPESVRDRPTKAHEYLFLLAKGPRYFYDAEAAREDSAQPDRVRADRFGGNKHGAATTKHSDGSVFTGSAKRNRRTVWTVAPKPFRGAHFAVMPAALVEPCVLAGSRPGDMVLDPFTGSGTVGAVAVQHGRRFFGVELNPAYAEMARARIGGVSPLFAREEVA